MVQIIFLFNWMSFLKFHTINLLGGFSPTHLKNMRSSKWEAFPQGWGVNIKHTLQGTITYPPKMAFWVDDFPFIRWDMYPFPGGYLSCHHRSVISRVFGVFPPQDSIHQEHPGATDFGPESFVERKAREGTDSLRLKFDEEIPEITISHRIHVWYIYLHLVDFYGQCRYIHHTWMVWVFKRSYLFQIFIFLVSICKISRRWPKMNGLSWENQFPKIDIIGK